MAIQKALFPSHLLMPPKMTDSMLSEDFLPVSHPEVWRTEGKRLSLLPAQLQPMQTLKSYERNVPDVTVCACVCSLQGANAQCFLSGQGGVVGRAGFYTGVGVC